MLSSKMDLCNPAASFKKPSTYAKILGQKAMKIKQKLYLALSFLIYVQYFESVHIYMVYIILVLNMYTDECVYRYIFAICIIPCIFIHTQLDIVRNLVKQRPGAQ